MSLVSRIKVAIKRWTFSNPGRDRRQRPGEIIAALGIQPGDVVADLGSGTGYYTFRLARAAGPTGRVSALDTDPDLLDDLERQATREGVTNLRTTQPRADEPSLPEPVDLVFLSHVYHHLPERVAYFSRMAGSLRAGGRIAIIEGRIQGWARILGHASDPGAVRREMVAAGYRLAASHDVVPHESFQVFVRDGGDARSGTDSQTHAEGALDR
jgi:arsenite methyltransferase